MAATKISALTTDSAPVRSTDYVPTYDASAVATKKVLLNNLGVMLLNFEFANSSPADATTYYFGAWGTSALQTTTGARRIHILRAGVLTYGILFGLSGGGSGETSTISVRKNATTDTTITSTFATNTQWEVGYTLSISVAVNDFVEVKWVTPSWATNPTGLYTRFTLLLE